MTCTLEAHSVTLSSHCGSVQSKSKKNTTTAGNSEVCFFIQSNFSIPLGRDRAGESSLTSD